MFRISKRFEFCASHELTGLPADHPCTRLHGHNYAVEVELEGDTDDRVGFVADYHALGGVKRWIDEHLDHRHLNDVKALDFNPTAENLARFLYGITGALVTEELHTGGWVASHDWRVSAVRVMETPKTVAEWRQ